MIISEEGEGAVLRQSFSLYLSGRSPLLLKLKSAVADQDAIVVKVEPDKSVRLKLANGTTFDVANERVQVGSVKVGDIVTFNFESSSRRVIPSNPSITRIRSDVDWDDVVFNAAKEEKYISENERGSGYTKQGVGYWSMRAMRQHLEGLSRSLGFDPLLASSWYHISERDVRQDKGGRVVLQKLKGYVEAITRLFPELRLEKSAFPFPQSWWRSVGNRRKFFEMYATTHNFDSLQPDQWYSQPRDKIMATKGAYRVMFYHENSVTKALMDLFPEIVWDKLQLRFPKHRFAEARRVFFENYAKDNHFDPIIALHWYSQPIEKILSVKGARKVILYHNSNVARALIELFPEVHFDSSKLPNDKSDWSVPEQRRLFFENYARANGFDPLIPDNWYSHSKEKILQEKHATDVIFYHNNSISAALGDLFPKIGLIKCKLKQPRWLLKNKEQRREVMEGVAEQKGFDPLIPNNWYSQDFDEIRSMKGMQGLLLYHQRSAPQALIDLFPEIEFDVTKFHSTTWRDVRNRRSFFDEYAKEKGFDSKIPEHWYKQSIEYISSLPGATSVLAYHNNSVIKALQDLYRDIGIDKSKFNSASKWNDYENRLQFFKMFAKENGFDPLLPANWYSISASQLRARTGARKVLLYHQNSIIKALLDLFPAIGLNKRKLYLSIK